MAGSGALTGRQLGDYQLGRLLYDDSFGTVYEASHASLRGALALRVLSERLTFAAGFEERFSRVARVLSILEHPNLLSLDDYGMDGSYTYLVTPLVEATSLETWLRQRPQEPISPAQTMRIIGQLTSVLDYLHLAGVTHRGVAPETVLLEPHGHLLLASTGLPYLAEELWRGWNERRAVGNPVFLAPEQLDGSTPAGAPCDIYAVGVLLYRLLSGTLPFDLASPSILEAKYKPPPSLRNLKHAPPPALEAIALRALHPAPEQRWSDINELAEAFYAAMQQAGYERAAGAAPGSAYRYISNQQPGPVSSEGPTRGATASSAKEAGLTAPYLPAIPEEAPRARSIAVPQPTASPFPVAPPAALRKPRRSAPSRAKFVIFTTLKILLLPLVLGLLGYAILYGYQRLVQIQSTQHTPTPSVTPKHSYLSPHETQADFVRLKI
jgi:serine/threonine-protein kinase